MSRKFDQKMRSIRRSIDQVSKRLDDAVIDQLGELAEGTPDEMDAGAARDFANEAQEIAVDLVILSDGMKEY